MPVQINIPPQLREQTGGQANVPVSGQTVREALADLVRQHPAVQTKLFDESGQLRRFLNVFVNEEDIRYLEELDTPLTGNEVVVLLPAVAGG
jgi:molybdopterin converting factor small subunit